MHRKTVIDFRALGERYTFTQPIKELKTRSLAEVADLLAQVESYQEQGYYVVGYVSYEAAPAFEGKLAVHSGPLLGEYLLYFTVHNSVETSNIPLTYEEVDLPSNWQELTSAEDYEKAIAQIHHHLRQGDTYQVNPNNLLTHLFLLYDNINFHIILSNLFQQFKKTSSYFCKFFWFGSIQDMRAMRNNLKLRIWHQLLQTFHRL